MESSKTKDTQAETPHAESDKKIKIIIKQGSTGEQTQFKVNKTTKFEKIINIYCQRQGVPASQLRLIFDGMKIKGTDTPESLGLEDEDQIDAFIEQVGGRSEVALQ